MRDEEINKPDTRPYLTVWADNHTFTLKYLERQFNRRINRDLDLADKDFPVFIITEAGKEVPDAASSFIINARTRNLTTIHIRVPMVIGTGMTGMSMFMAKRIANGTMHRIKDNKAVWSIIHAVDVAKVARLLADNTVNDVEIIVSPPPTPVNDFIDALATRIKNKKTAILSAGLSKFLYSKKLFKEQTSDKVVDTSEFNHAYPDFIFNNPAEYLKTHIYNDESL